MDYQSKGGLSTNLMLTHDPIVAQNHVMPETLLLELAKPCYQQFGVYCLHAMIQVYAFSFNQQLQKQHYSPPFVPYWLGSAILDPIYSLPNQHSIRYKEIEDGLIKLDSISASAIPRSILGFNVIIGEGHNHGCGIDSSRNYPDDPDTKELQYLWGDMNKYGYFYNATKNPKYMMRVVSFYRYPVV